MKKSRRGHLGILWAWILVTALFAGIFPAPSQVSVTAATQAQKSLQTSESPMPEESPADTRQPLETGVPEMIPDPEEKEEPDPTDDSFETAEPDPASFRIMFTSDIHGQVTTEDYESGRSNYTTGGYSRTVSLIKKARTELNEKNSMLFDLGDNLYDYTTDYIYEYDPLAEQPIYTALSKMDYDAITLGNHEFEYTLEYLKDQLVRTGLTEKVVLSNVWDAVTKKHVWAENKIITKKIITSSGKEMEVKVGLIGETIPKLSKKKTDFTGILETEDIIENVKKESALLKEQGADIVVVLGHTGIGGENPGLNADDTGYALTKLSNVNVVLCGHKHRDFPLKRGTIYDSLSGVDPETKLVNGKPLVQVQNRGASLGIVDLQLDIRGGQVQILGAKTEVREVDEFTAVDQEINDCEGKWSKIFMSDCSEVVCDISDQADLQNYFGTVEDTDAIQLLNNIKISCALLQKGAKLSKYKTLPVVAASTYFRFGLEDDNDYIDIRDHFKRANIYNIIKYKTKLVLYQMTGAQIKEWMEWSASGYEEPGKSVLFYPSNASGSGSGVEGSLKSIKTDEYSYPYDDQIQYVLKKNYLNNWNSIYFFDGLDYTIDTTIAPRYDRNGNKINDTSRIVSLCRNGVEIKPEDKFLIVTETLPTNHLFSEMKPKSLMKYSATKYRAFVEEYLRQLSHNGGLKPIADQNWHIIFSDTSNYLLKSSVNAERFLETKPWLFGTLGKVEDLQYYLADFRKFNNEDKTGPVINTAVLNLETTNKDVEIFVQVTDESGIQSLKYISGKYVLDSEVWNTGKAKTIKDGGSFRCDKNGVYTIYAVDGRGNKELSYVEISNINNGVLSAPVVDTYTNKNTEITGKAEPNATVYFWLENGKTYTTKVGKKGKFSCKIPPQKAGTTIYAYAADSQGRASARTVIVVKRTGPNQPVLKNFTTASKKISGSLEDTYAYPVLFVGTKDVYVGNANVKGLFQKSELFDKSYNVFIISIDIKQNGEFSVNLPNYIPAGTEIKLCTVDVVYRASLAVSRKCQLALPNQPVSVSEITNLSRTVKVFCTLPCDSAVVTIGKAQYSEKKYTYDGKKKLYCYAVPIPRTDSTYVLKVYLKNAKGISKKITITPKEKVPDLPKITKCTVGKKKIVGMVDLVGPTPGPNVSDRQEKRTITVKVKEEKEVDGKIKTIIKNEKKVITVTIPAIVISTKTKVHVFVNKKKYKADITAKGKFTLTLKKPLKKGDKIVCQAQNLEGMSLKYRKDL